MSIITLLPGHNFEALNDFAGNEGLMAYWDPTTLELEMPGIDQATADQALLDYAADQVNIDNDFADKVKDQKDDALKDEFDDDSIVTAIIKEMVEQLNDIRTNAGMPLLNFGTVNAAIRSRIGQP